MTDDDRRRILERRERFLRATLWGATAGALLSACDPSGPVCHSARRNLPRAVVRTVGCDAPLVCLSVAIVDAGAPSPVAGDAATEDAGGDG